jgi:release factor glutamine methyltransferase
MPTVKGLLQEATERITESDTARLDAEVLLSHVLDRNRAWLYTWPDKVLVPEAADKYRGLIERRVAGEPVAHLTGVREFWGLELACDNSTLIPRPETELLVEQALQLRLPDRAQVLDLGTGTGAIALALAKERPKWQLRGTDSSAGAISLARANAKKLGVRNVKWFKGDWFQPLDADVRFDLILSNPPYIPEDDACLGEGDVRFEPRSALVSGEDGLDAILRLVAGAGYWLNPKGWMLLEHGYNQTSDVREILATNGFNSITCFEDLAGHKRATLARWVSA